MHMALSKDKKQQIIEDAQQKLSTSKLTVVTAYQGTPVKAMQELRKLGAEDGTTLKVYKNRLFKQAISQTDGFKDVDTSALEGMLLYAFNSDDEVAPAQVIAKFAKKQPNLQFVGAYTAEGEFLAVEDVKALADLPSKQQLRGMLVGTIAAPLTGFMNVMNGNLRGVLNVLQARADTITE